MEEMAKKNLTDFALIRSRAQWNRGREFVFQESSDQANVFIRLYVSLQDKNQNELQQCAKELAEKLDNKIFFK